MNRSFYVLAFFCLNLIFPSSIISQDSDQNWFSNLEKATEDALITNKNILVVFSGSDWCRPCMKFKEDVLTHSSFTKFAYGKLNVLYLDFPAKKKNKLSKEQQAHNEALAEEFNRNGVFPKIILLNSKAEVVSEIPYEGQQANEFIANVKTKMNSND
jgi:thioredoxin-related protein